MGTILECDASGFITESTVSINANATHAYDAMAEVHMWWDSSHSFSLDAKNLSLVLKPGGRFLESFGDNEGVVHSTVVFAKRGEVLRLSGALGPLQMLGAQGTLTLQFKKSEIGTNLTATYHVIGRNLEDWAVAVEQVLFEQLVRLKNFVETGDPVSTRD
ncbi:MAG: ATPase [Gammaproteobacteria bacterium]|nr:ATPase [Gammaproteobacteria bacterium]